MVPIPESKYFPALDKCLNGEDILITWERAFVELSARFETGEELPFFDNFFDDSSVKQIFSAESGTAVPNAFPTPTQQTKAAFETKTSAINVTPSSTRFDIKEVKEDALWLSKEVTIDELAALRVVVVERQSRASAQLLGPFSIEEVSSLREAYGNDARISAGASESASISGDFDSQRSRRIRLLRIYLSERRNFWKCLELLIRYGPTSSLHGISRGIPSKEIMETVSQSSECSIPFIKTIRSNFESLVRPEGSGWLKAEGTSPDLEVERARSLVTEIIQAMEIVFCLVNLVSREMQPSKIVLEWFRMLSSFGYLAEVDMPEASVQALVPHVQLLSSLISVIMLNAEASISHLETSTNASLLESAQRADCGYLKCSQTVKEIHTMIYNVSSSAHKTTGPLVLAWSKILKTMRQAVSRRSNGRQTHEDESVDVVEGALQAQHDLDLRQFEDLVDEIIRGAEEDTVDELARSAVNGSEVFETLSEYALSLGKTNKALFPDLLGAKLRVVILCFIRDCGIDIGYVPEIVTTALSALTGGEGYWDPDFTRKSNYDTMEPHNNPINWLLGDGPLSVYLLDNALHRFPFEATPFLKLMRLIASCKDVYGDAFGDIAGWDVVTMLERMPSFTIQLPDDFFDYRTIDEEDNTNNIQLIGPLQLFQSRSKYAAVMGSGQAYNQLDLINEREMYIPQDTRGRIVTDQGPKVAYFFYEFSALRYLGKLLETYLSTGDHIYVMAETIVDREYVAEIIRLIVTLLRGLQSSAGSPKKFHERSRQLLSSASESLDRDRDIMTVIFDIFEEELQRQSLNLGQDVPLELLCACLQFMHAILPIAAAQVWPLLGRSGLLGVEHGVGRLSVIVGNIEAVSGRFDFLVSCSKLFEALVDDVIHNAVRRKYRNPSTNRFEPAQDTGIMVSDRVLSKVLSSFTHHILEAFEASSTWVFMEPSQRPVFNACVMRTFVAILDFGFGLEGTPTLRGSIDKLAIQNAVTTNQVGSATESTSTLSGIQLAAQLVASNFLSTSAGILRFQPILRALIEGLDLQEATASPRLLTTQLRDIGVSLDLSTRLLRVSAHLSMPSSALGDLFFKASPIIARLYAVNQLHSLPVVEVLEALIVRASSNTQEPPSLLGHLGKQTSQSFLEVLINFDKPSSITRLVHAIWHFLSAAISTRQQWFAYFILTGSTPREVLGSKSESRHDSIRPRTVFDIALDTLIDIEQAPRQEALRALQFITVAQNFCPWTMNDSPRRKPFIKSISAFLASFPVKISSTEPAVILESTQIAACITEILAMYLFRMRETGDASLASELEPKWSTDFTQYALRPKVDHIITYNRLKNNFGKRYFECPVDTFRKTDINGRELGDNYYLDRKAAHRMLVYDEAWNGNGSQNYETEFRAVNFSASIEDAQLALLSSFRVLALELSSNISSQPKERDPMAEIVKECLNANKNVEDVDQSSATLCQMRADLGLHLMQRLTTNYPTNVVLQAIMRPTWDTICRQEITFESALGAGDATYYRTLLKILFLGINVHADKRQSKSTEAAADRRGKTPAFMGEASKTIPTVLLILERIVAKGFRDLAVVIHEAPESSTPEDVALITGILQGCLRIPGIEFCHPQILNIMATHDSPRTATNLFSWFDRLAINGDPIYGELSILFLLELSSISLMAEQLAVDGILGHISSANITSYLRRGNVSPFAEGAGLQRCYNIWVRGILPFLLNILTSVGGSIAGEVALFLEQYPALLQQAASAFDAPGSSRLVTRSSKVQSKYITLSICSEVHSLSLIFFILNGYREQLKGIQEVPEVEWDAGTVLENVEYWLGSRALLRDRIVPMGERDELLARKKVAANGDGKAISSLEEKIARELEGIRDVLGGGDA